MSEWTHNETNHKETTRGVESIMSPEKNVKNAEKVSKKTLVLFELTCCSLFSFRLVTAKCNIHDKLQS